MSKHGKYDRSEDMSAALVSEGKSGVADLKTKLQSNKLVYSFPPSLGVCKSRSLVKNVAPSTSYNDGQLMVIHINSGDTYVNPQTSYISFQGGWVSGVAPPGDAKTNAYFGTGSAANFFNSVTLTSASGVEIERVESANLCAVFMDRVMGNLSQNQLWTVAGASGYTYGFDSVDRKISGSVPGAAAWGQTTALLPYWTVPLGTVLGLFKASKLIPPYLLSGARIEFQLETALNALQYTSTTTVTAPTFQIVNPALNLDCYILEDAVQLALQKIAAKDGLVFAYNTVDVTNIDIVGSGTVEVDCRKAVSVANTILAIRRPPISNVVATQQVLDNFATGKNRWYQMQFNLGSLYLPNQVMTVPSGLASVATAASSVQSGWAEFYTNTMYAVEGYTTSGTACTFSDYFLRNACVGATLERSTVLSLSGMPVASARAIHLSARLTSSSGDDNHTITLMLIYTRLAKLFLDRVIIRD